MRDVYTNPLIERYASREMLYIFSADEKFSTWRKLWVALAKGERECGIDISEEQIKKMEENIYNIDYDKAREYENEFRHDVMAHVHTFGDTVPESRGIIHLGATSAYVGDNTDLIIYKKAMELIKKQLVNLIKALSDFALEYKALPTLGFTHFQPAQLTTVGKRATLWIQDLLLDLEEIDFVLSTFRMRGVKGTTGTQASFMALFNNDEEKIKKLNKFVCREMGFDDDFTVTGQTYPRKFDSRVVNALSAVAQSLHKFATDIRLLQNLKEIEEPFEKSQIGSSAMAYKRNPMRSERICSLSRLIMANALNPPMTASVQWFERTLDDSANRRISIPESFLCLDGILQIAINIASGLQVYEKVIHKHIMAELPFMTSENILMESVKRGGDRQALHEKIRVYSMEAGAVVKKEGKENDLLERIAKDSEFNLNLDEIKDILKPEKYIGRSIHQVEEFYENDVKPVLEENKELLGMDVELKV